MGFTKGHFIGFGLAFLVWVMLCVLQANQNTQVKRTCSVTTHKIISIEGPFSPQLLCVKKLKNSLRFKEGFKREQIDV